MTTRPENLPGGCLCRSIRFSVSLEEEDWPPKTNGTCQCTMCRKHSGALLPQNWGVKTKSISPPLGSNADYKKYQSSENGYRGFCQKCGSSLTFGYLDQPDMTEINLGVFDEEVLCGRLDEDNAWEDEYGRHVPRIGGVGKAFSAPDHIFVENSIPGVTDELPGKKWLRDRTTEPFTCKLTDFKQPA